MPLLLHQRAQQYEKLQPIMEACGTALAPRDFYWAVNLAFHSAESECYEREHAGMIAAMPEKWKLLLAPLRARRAGTIRWLDIGCGPGVLGRVVAGILGDTVGEAVFLDPNSRMLRLCEAKSHEWPFPGRFVQGTISDLSAGEGFDLITCNSVLHHIVELGDFCRTVSASLISGGLFAHCYDPRREAVSDRVLARRRAVARYAHAWRAVTYRVGETYRRITRSPSATRLVEAETNRELLKLGAVRIPLDIRSIWAVTDFHVPQQPGSFGQGISAADLQASLPGLRPQEYFSYCFFGRDDLIAPFRQLDQRFYRRRDPHGALFGASWIKL
jgi:SAM-dependent methyltransferase